MDTSGVKAVTCDPHGWFYSFNFQSLPFTGRTTGRHPMPCVRRRRWHRAHVPAPWAPITPALVAALQPPDLPTPHRTPAPPAAAAAAAGAEGLTPAMPGRGASLPVAHSANALELHSAPKQVLRRPGSAAAAVGQRAGAGLQDPAEAAWCCASSGAPTASPCTPRSPPAKLDLRSGGSSEELTSTGGGGGGSGGDRHVRDAGTPGGKHKRTCSTPHLFSCSMALGSPDECDARRRHSLGGDSRSCAGAADRMGDGPLGRAGASFPLVASEEVSVGSASVAAAQGGSEAIDELLRSWSERFYGSA